MKPGKRELSVLTWNIVLAKSSAAAPPSWHRDDGVAQLTAMIPLVLSEHPQVVALQEIPYPRWAAEVFSPAGYRLVGTAESHCGCTALLVQEELARKLQRVHVIGPCVLGCFDFDGFGLAIASMHLAPHESGALQRHECLGDLISVCQQSMAAAWVLCGDWNLRQSEEDTLFGTAQPALLDCWKLSGVPAEFRVTWDSYRNRFWPRGRKFRAHFDRICVWPLATVREYRLVGEQPLTSDSHFVSDHYGIFTRLVFS